MSLPRLRRVRSFALAEFMLCIDLNRIRAIARNLIRIQCREAAQSAQAVVLQNQIKLRLIVQESRSLALGMPQVQHAGREASVLAPHAAAEEPNKEVGILASPAGELRIEAVDPLEIIAKAGHIAGAGALPAPAAELAQG